MENGKINMPVIINYACQFSEEVLPELITFIFIIGVV